MTGRVEWGALLADGPLSAMVRVPGSKSLTARWLVLAAVADEPSQIRGALSSRDTRLMRDALEQLGAVIESEQDEEILRVMPLPPSSEHRADPIEIHAGLAGTVMRFVPPVAALRNGDVRITGDEAALRRPMGPVIDALRALGVEVTEEGEPARLPITIHGTGAIRGGRVEIDASASSQFVSNLLLIGARADADLELVHVGESLPSLPHIEMTLATLRQAGVEARHRIDEDGRHAWIVRRGQILPGSVVIEPDLSNAGPFLAAPMIAGGSVGVIGWPESTTQAGDAFRGLLAAMGAEVFREDDAIVVTGTGHLRGIDVDMSAHGELVPTIAALAALADSPTRIRGVAHLRGHETDRLHALATELTKLGAATVETADGLEITPGELVGTAFETYEDHRMATAGAIIGLRVPDMRVVDVQTTQKTLPDFVGMWLAMLHTDAPAGGTR